MAESIIILGIDPGSRCTGYGVVLSNGSEYQHLTHGHIQTQGDIMADRLGQIYTKLAEVIQEYQPRAAAIEQVFMHKNAQSALKLGQARGAALVAVANAGLECHEYSARQIKQAVVGYGAAAKSQVQHMISTLLRLKDTVQSDAADALAAAVCHANTQQLTRRLASATITAGDTR